MGHSALSSPAARAQQSAHTTLDMTNECLLPCPLDMPFAPLLRFVDSALGAMCWTGALDWIAFVELLLCLLTAICVAAYVKKNVRICAAIVATTSFAAIIMETQAAAAAEQLEAEGEAEAEADEEEAEIETVVTTLPIQTTMRRPLGLAPLALPGTCESKDSDVPELNCFRKSPTQRPRVQRGPGFGAVHCIEQAVIAARSFREARVQRGFGAVPFVERSTVITASSYGEVHKLALTTRRFTAACRLQCRGRGLVARRKVAALRAQARAACQLQCRWRTRVAQRWACSDAGRDAQKAALVQAKRHARQEAAFDNQHRDFAHCSPEVAALRDVAKADPCSFNPERRLGAGAFGTVYRTRGGEAALKVVSLRNLGKRIFEGVEDSGMESRKAAAALVKEARLLRMANADGGHPHLLRIHASFTMGGHACIALDLAAGGDLHRYMRRTHSGRLPLAEAFLYTQQLAEAVAWLHVCNVAHRDIKLDNVLLLREPGDEPGHVMLADFGLGADLSSLRKWEGQPWCNTACGTHTTMAPEVIDGDPYYPPLADVWSLGVTALALFAPRTPDEHGCDWQGYYAWSSAAWHSSDENGDDFYEDGEYSRYVTLLNDADVTPTPRSTAIAKLLQMSDEHDRMPQELPAAVLVALDRMLCIDPDTRISAADVVSLLAEPLSF